MVDYGWGPVSQEPPATQYQQHVTQRTETAATAAFVLSLLGVFTWGLSCIVALFLAPAAKRSIKVSPTTRKGKGLAIAAQVISIWSLLSIITLAFVILGF